MDFGRSRLPTAGCVRPGASAVRPGTSGIRPPMNSQGVLRKSYSSDSVGPKSYGQAGRGLMAPSSTSRSSVYLNRQSGASAAASSARKPFSAMASARKSRGGLFGMTPQNKR